MVSRAQSSGPLAIAVGGGKGGVGKSMLAANLGVAIAHLGGRAVLVDADLGSANLHTMLGIDRPGPTLRALLEREVDELAEVVVPTGIQGLELVPGSVAIPGAANLGHGRKLKLLRHIARLDADVVIIDCGAGVHFNVLDFYNAADLHLVVATPQLISLQNAYGFCKAAVYRLLRQTTRNAAERQLVDSAPTSTETERVRDLLGRLEGHDASLALHLRHQIDHYNLQLIGNQVGDRAELNPVHALARMLSDFLTLRVPVVGALRQSARVHQSVTRRVPFLSAAPGDRESRLLLSLAERYLETDVRAMRELRALPPEEEAPPDPKAQDATEAGKSGLPGSLQRFLRAHERLEVLWPATLVLKGRSYKAQVTDISQGGMKLAWGGVVERGAHVAVRIDSVPLRPVLHCQLVHQHEDGLGLQFDPLPTQAELTPLLTLAFNHQRPEVLRAGTG